MEAHNSQPASPKSFSDPVQRTAHDILYENERRGLFDGFSSEDLTEKDPRNWTDSHGKPASKDGFPLPSGWEWAGDWEVDAANEKNGGWEYAVVWHSTWQKEEKPSLFVRRRRWKRERCFKGGGMWNI